MDCTFGRQRNPFCYIFSRLLAASCLHVMTGCHFDTQHWDIWQQPLCHPCLSYFHRQNWDTLNMKTSNPWSNRKILAQVLQVRESTVLSKKEGAPSCQLTLPMNVQQCHQMCRCWGLYSCNMDWKIQKGFWCHAYHLRGLGWPIAESKISLSDYKGSDFHWVPCPVPVQVNGKMPGCHHNWKHGSGIATLEGWQWV